MVIFISKYKMALIFDGQGCGSECADVAAHNLRSH